MATLTYIEPVLTNKRSDKQATLAYWRGDDLAIRNKTYVPLDKFYRLYSIRSSTIENKEDLEVLFTISWRSEGSVPSNESIQQKVRLSLTPDRFVEVGLNYNYPYSMRAEVFIRVKTPNSYANVQAPKNFTSNSWNENSYKFEVRYTKGVLRLKINDYYTYEDIVMPKLPVNQLTVFHIYRGTKAFEREEISREKFFKTRMNAISVDGVVPKLRTELVDPYLNSMSYPPSEIEAIADETLIIDEPPTMMTPGDAEVNNVDDSNRQSKPLEYTSVVDEVIKTRGKKLFYIDPNEFKFRVSSVEDERFMDPKLAMAANARLTILISKYFGVVTSETYGLMIVAMIQLALTYSTVKNSNILPSYSVNVSWRDKMITIPLADVRAAIVGGQLDTTPTNLYRSYMRYWTNTTIDLLNKGVVENNESVAAKHGVPKKFMMFCFDFCIMSTEYYNRDALTAASYAAAYAIKFSHLKGRDKEKFNLFENS